MKILEKIGLTKNEIKVYLSLLELGSSKAGEIIKKVNLHRSKVYDTLERLLDKGLVSYIIKNKIKFFEASSPDNLLDILDKKERDLDNQKKELKKTLSSLKIKKSTKKEEKVSVFEGNKGIRSILNDMIKDKKEIHNIAAYSEEAEALKYSIKYFFPKFHKLRGKMKYIFPEESKKRALEVKNLKNTEVKILPTGFSSSMSTTIYGDKVAIIMWTKDPIGILIKDKEIAKNQEKYFHFLWKISKK